MKRVIAALFAGVAGLAAGQALAADLLEPVPVAPIAAIPERSAFDWTGFYVGATAAYGWGEYGIDAGGVTASPDADGFTGGAFLGYNYAVTPNWIVGGEADVMMSGSDNFTVGGVDVKSDSPLLSTVRARVGYAFDRFMVYGTGGLALGFGEAKINGESDSNTHVGWAAGAGVEAALTDNITARAEYLYIDTTSERYTAGGSSADVDLDASLVKFGIAYKF
ncbi:MAG TPA: outer membrane protein [Methylomirabilota bacterium]|nr:outer membrane protein [Methylomirabilota bacterium]